MPTPDTWGKRELDPQQYVLNWLWANHNVERPTESVKGRTSDGFSPPIQPRPTASKSPIPKTSSKSSSTSPPPVLQPSPPHRSGSTPSSRRSSDTFSQKTLSFESATENDKEATESDSDGSDGSGIEIGKIGKVIRRLDSYLLTVLRDNLDLAARLIPEIHRRLNEDYKAGILSVSESSQKIFMSSEDDGGSKGKQRASGNSSPTNQSSPFGSSPRKHSRGSGTSSGRRRGSGPNKRPRP